MSEELTGLIGETLTHIDVFSGNECDDNIMLTTKSGRKFHVYHEQDCCESVYIESIEGDWRELIGKVIVEASCDEIPEGNPPPEYPESWTRTNFRFRVDDTTVICRWIGESNGYYSESVTLKEITQ